MMPETSLEDAIQFAEKIRAMVQEAVIVTTAGTVSVTVSIGVSSFPRTKFATTRELIDSADKALYRAKRGGRNRVEAELRHDPARKTRRPQEDAGDKRMHTR